ncbi:DUF7118 family protein [Natronosalvus rutilus]|uniref:Uncharacterized protein n=1 Tax=Natronosalvus rutilus TaxID=2953753 RepID=A0A9E7NB82_9EURY|nr:hypothetical protein [Natronosalvus rutilus]UTF53824.1 hypothetical protein NGM29_00635 [Natronosalvus rutilus]
MPDTAHDLTTGDGSDPRADADAARERLERASERLEAAKTAIDEAGGRETVETGADAYRSAASLLDRYVDLATGTGRETFKHYINLEGEYSTLVEDLPADLPHREAFEASFEAVDKRRLHESDFESAESALGPAERFVDLLQEEAAAEEEVTLARKAATDQLDALEDEISDLQRLRSLADADLEAPVDRLRDPIEAYNESIREAFESFLYDRSARTVFDLLERSRLRPFVDFETPPPELREYVEDNDAGTYSIPELLEYAEYSRSKLDHYVDDPDELKRRIATRQTYLERIDATPLTLSWPPADATTLRYAIRDRRPLVERIGGQELVEGLLAVRERTYDDDYDRLQTAANALDQLSATERERLQRRDIDAELEGIRDAREELEAALADG